MNLVIWPRSPRVPHSSVVRASNRHVEGRGFDSRWEDSDFSLSYHDCVNISSFNNITTCLNIQVMRIEEMITKDKMS